MSTYYNKTRAPVTVSLKNGESAMVPPRKTLRVSRDQDGSGSLHACLRKGLLVRLRDADPVVEAAPVEAAAPEAAPPVDAPSLSWTKAELIDFAENSKIEVASGWTKAEILEAIEGA